MEENNELIQEVPAVRKIDEVDRLAIELAKVNRKVALANAEKALAQNETAELAYKHTVLQIYVKYGLTFNDALQEDGTITLGGLIPKG